MQAGALLGPYRIERELGSGGMGKVYAALAEGRVAGLAPGTRVALKVVHPHLLETEGFFKRFLREADIGRAVDDPNVVRTLDCDSVTVDGARRDFIVMEYVDGQTLRQLLDELQRVPEELCRHIGREVCKGLGAIHAAGAVHRDVKPDNVLITPDHVVKLMDLGVARLTDEAIRLSQTGAFVGSLQYAAPEQFRGGGRDLDGRADLHALGLVLYELASGASPYVAADVAGSIRKVLHEAPRRLGEVNPQLSPFYEEAVHKLLAKERDERFAGALEFLAVLEEGEESAWWRERAQSICAETKRPIRRIRIPRETAVHGREGELEKLRGLFERARSGDGQVVLVEGEAGIGKSRVVDELIGRLQRDGEDLDFLFGSYPPGGAATAEGAFSIAYREQFGEAGSASYLEETPRLVPAFDALLRGDAHPADAQALNKQSLQTCFVHATRALAAARPTVVLIDDLHFAPEEGRALFSALAMAVAGHRVLLIGTARPGLSEAWHAGVTRHDHVSQVALERLGPKDLVKLLTDALRSPDLATRLAGQIGLKSDGNPFFVFEIVRGLREGQFITQSADGSWVTTDEIHDILIPSSVLDLVNARVAELDVEERDLVDVAACCGFEFDPSLVADALGVPVLPTLKRFAQIERRHRLVRSMGRHMVFDHHQIQESLYGGLMEQIREHYHAAIGGALERRAARRTGDAGGDTGGDTALEICEHLLRGDAADRAVPFLEAALEHLKAGHLHAAVTDLAGRALDAPGVLSGSERLDMLLRREASLLHQGRADEQRTVIAEALALAESLGDRVGVAKVHRRSGQLLLRTGRPEEAERVLEAALAAARDGGDRRLVGALFTNLGNVCQALGRRDEARAYHEQSLAVAREIGSKNGEIYCLGNLEIVEWSIGRNEEAERFYKQSIALAQAEGDTGGEAVSVGNLALVVCSYGRNEEAERLLLRNAELSRSVGSRKGEAYALGNLGTVYDALGRIDRAQEHYERCIELSREIEMPEMEAIARLNVGDALLRQGANERAATTLETALDLAERVRSRDAQASALHRLGELAERRGDPAEAERRYRAALALRASRGVRDRYAAGTTLTLAVLLAETGRPEPARKLLAEALSMGREAANPDTQVLALLYDALFFDADPAPAIAAYERHATDLKSDCHIRALWLLHRLTAAPEHLTAAKRLVDDFAAHATPELRESTLENVPLHRDILAAAEERAP